MTTKNRLHRPSITMVVLLLLEIVALAGCPQRPRRIAPAATQTRNAEIAAEGTRLAETVAERTRQAAAAATQTRLAEIAEIAAERTRRAETVAEQTRQAEIAAEQRRQAGIHAEETRQAEAAIHAEETRQAEIAAEQRRQAEIHAEETRQAAIYAEETRPIANPGLGTFETSFREGTDTAEVAYGPTLGGHAGCAFHNLRLSQDDVGKQLSFVARSIEIGPPGVHLSHEVVSVSLFRSLVGPVSAGDLIDVWGTPTVEQILVHANPLEGFQWIVAQEGDYVICLQAPVDIYYDPDLRLFAYYTVLLAWTSD